MIASVDDPTPTGLGVLMLSAKPMDFIPCAYIQFVRFAGEDRGGPIVDVARFDGPVPDSLYNVDAVIRSHIRTSVETGAQTTEIRRSTYAFDAIQELVRNAVMHRAYEYPSSHSPIQVYWFTSHIEIINPGGPFGDITVDNFGPH